MSVPPVHPALVHLPLALVLFSFVADAVAKAAKKQSLALAGYWSLIGALIGGGRTIAAGYWDMNHATLSGETHEFVHQHLTIGWILAACLFGLTLWRWQTRKEARPFVTLPYLMGASFVCLLTLFQGWYGGEMVYSHGAGVAVAGQGTETAAAAEDRLSAVHNFLEPMEKAVGSPGHHDEAEHGYGERMNGQ